MPNIVGTEQGDIVADRLLNRKIACDGDAFVGVFRMSEIAEVWVTL